MNKTDTQLLLAALEINRVMAKDSDGNYTREVTPKLITAAIAICEASLALVEEPVAAVKKDAVLQESIDFIRELTGMEPPPIEVAPAETFQPFKTFTDKVCALFAAPQEPAASEWIPVSERLPETGVMVIVRSPAQDGDWTDDDRIAFDHISEDYEDWHAHCESFEHYMAVGGSNAAGPDVVCTGPSQKAPYTHWTPIPAFRKEGKHEQA